MKKTKISVKIAVFVMLLAMGALIAVSIASYLEIKETSEYQSSLSAELGETAAKRSQTALESQTEEFLLQISVSQSELVEKEFSSLACGMAEMSQYMTSLYRDPDNFQGKELPKPDETEEGVASSKYLIAPGITMTDQLQEELYLISNAEYAFAPFFLNHSSLANVYLGTETGLFYRYCRTTSGSDEYDPRTRSWYVSAKANQDSCIWIGTYVDVYGVVCITCAQAFFDGEGNFHGVVAADVTLETVSSGIASIQVGDTGYAFIIDKDTKFVAGPENVLNGAQYLREIMSTDDAYTIRTIRWGDSGQTHATLNGKECFLAFTTIEETGWKICVAVESQEILSSISDTETEIRNATSAAQQNIQKALQKLVNKYIITLIVIACMVTLLSIGISSRMSRPIRELANFAREIGKGKFDTKVPVTSNDEVGELAQTFNTMTDDLNRYIASLTQLTADKERVNTELSLATEIQQSMLPATNCVLTDLYMIDLCATMDPAKEVAGDFYDFFLIDPDHLALVIADVSGKGVPASLFMMIAKTLIKCSAANELSPAEILSRANVQLCENNDTGMFVTAWIGILELSTGKMQCANAGHEYPVIRRAGGTFEMLNDGPHSLMLGAMDIAVFREYSITLDKGDTIFLYTDGVTEATDANKELFEEERLLKALNSHLCKDGRELLAMVRSHIDAFVADAPQFDDITMMAVTMLGDKKGE